MKIAVLLICMILPFAASAQDRDFTLSAPVEIVETGFLKHLLPRFSLKHGVRITQVDTNGDVVIGSEGTPVFVGLGTVWHITASDDEGPGLLLDWLRSDIGQRTVEAFEINGTAVFSTQTSVEIAPPPMTFDGDPVAGVALSLEHCGRCHVVNDTNRMNGMDQAPSFAVMRGFDDWQNRFSTFYVLNPHPSFSQVIDITQPFAANLPPAMVPIEITQDDLESILAYVATVAPADLGAPIQNQ